MYITIIMMMMFLVVKLSIWGSQGWSLTFLGLFTLTSLSACLYLFYCRVSLMNTTFCKYWRSLLFQDSFTILQPLPSEFSVCCPPDWLTRIGSEHPTFSSVTGKKSNTKQQGLLYQMPLCLGSLFNFSSLLQALCFHPPSPLFRETFLTKVTHESTQANLEVFASPFLVGPGQQAALRSLRSSCHPLVSWKLPHLTCWAPCV